MPGGIYVHQWKIVVFQDSLVEQSNLENNIKNVMQRNFGKVSGFPLDDGEKEQLDEHLVEELGKSSMPFLLDVGENELQETKS